MPNNTDAGPISCIITSYNNRDTIGSAVASVLNQSLPVAEIIVADDASTDGSQDLLRRLAERAPSVRVMSRTENVGVARNRDEATRAASQPFVTHLDGDDLIAPDKIKGEWSVLKGAPRDVACSPFATLKPMRPWFGRLRDPAHLAGAEASVVGARLASRSHVVPRDMLLSRALFIEAGGFEHDQRLYEDWTFKMRLASTGARWVVSRQLGTLYMQHAGSLSRAVRAEHEKGRSLALERAAAALARIGVKTGGTVDHRRDWMRSVTECSAYYAALPRILRTLRQAKLQMILPRSGGHPR